MKKIYFVLFLLSISYYSLSQTNMYWYNPFNFTPQLIIATGIGPNELITVDTSGQMWFLSADGANEVLHVKNQSGNVDYTINLGNTIGSNVYFHFDNRNILWLNMGDFLYQNIGGTFTLLNLPGGRSGYGYYSSVLSGKSGTDFILTEHFDTAHVDSSFITIYDGNTFQTTYLSGLGIPLNDSTVALTYAFVDTGGALYLDCKMYGFMKFDQGIWSHLAMTIDTLASPLLLDKNNNFYFLANDFSLLRMHGTTVDTIPTPPLIYNFNIGSSDWSFTLGPDGNIWFLSIFYGFFKLNPNGTWVSIPAPGFAASFYGTFDGLENQAIFDRKGRMWTTGGTSYPPYTIGVYSFTPFNSISGKVFYDANANGILDTLEAGFTVMNIVQTTDGFYSNTDTNGNYDVVFLDSTVSHLVTANPPQYYHLTTPGSYLIDTGHALCCYNFGVVADGNIQDLEITASSFCALPGYSSLTWLNYQNNGTTTVSDTVTYIFDTAMHYYNASPTPTIISGNKLSWAYQNLKPFQNNTIAIEFLTNTNSLSGDTLRSFATIYPLATDTTPFDNVYVNSQIVTSSFDPNKKTVTPSTGAAPGQELTYTIYFQNTGTAPAINIVVLDTLDTNLNPATFRLLGSSNHVKASLQGRGILSFTFDDIMLPDSSSDETRSTGFVKFAVSIADPLTHNASIIPNTAYINFDFNSPVQTNIATTSFSSTSILPIPMNTGLILNLAPNPANEQLLVQTDAKAVGGTLLIYDAIGNQIIHTSISAKKINLDIRDLSSGIYFVKLLTPNGQSESRKLVKQ